MQRKKGLDELSSYILHLDNIYSSSPSVYQDRLSLQAEFDNLSAVELEEMLPKSQHAYYNYGDKVSAHQIPQIVTPEGLTTDPQAINNQFRAFYSSL